MVASAGGLRRKRNVAKRGYGLLNRLVDSLPFEAHLGNRNYCGPGTKLKERLARGDKPTDRLDAACLLHDVEYDKYKDDINRARADRELIERAWQIYKSKDVSLGEKAAAWIVTTVMKGKVALGSGKAKKGGMLPLVPLVTGLSALGALAGQAASIAKSISDSSNAKKALAELRRHNLMMEGKGLYLKPYPKRTGKGLKKKKRSTKKKRRFL